MTTTATDFTIVSKTGRRPAPIDIQHAIIGGWTARDKPAMEHHIRELEALGVARPASTPIYYRVAARRITTADRIQVAGGESSGEVEFILVRHAGALFVGVGSDHTDRKVESYGITVAKQMCDKPVSRELWPYEEVREHWQDLVLRSFATIGDERVLYQEGGVTTMLDPEELMARYTGGAGALPDDAVMFGGTFAAIGGIRPADGFEMELEDPVLGRKIGHAYAIETLPVLG